MNNTSIEFGNAWILLLIIPAIILAFIPYFRLKTNRRRVRNKVVSMIIHISILVLVMLTVADIRFIQKDDLRSHDTIILVDASRSSVNSKAKIDNYIKETLENSKSSSRVGIVTFANECEYVAKLSSNYKNVYNSYINSNIDIKDNATNIENALNYAKNILRDYGGRIVVLTDGIETDGNALLKASEMSNEFFQIDTLLFDNDPLEKEIQITNIEQPENILLNEETYFDVVIETTFNTTCKVDFSIDDKVIESRDLFISDSLTRVRFVYTFTEAKEYSIYAKVEAKDDTYQENNIYYSVVNITLNNKVLIIDGTGNESTKLNALLSNSYDVDVKTVSKNMEVQLNDYKEVILMNASMETLPNNFDHTIKEYVSNGGNLLTTGGTNTYFNGKMTNTAFEEVLPITIEKDDMAPVGIMFVVDTSNSMLDPLSGSNDSRAKLAIEALKTSIKSMRNSDYVGIVSFNSSATQELPMTPLTRISNVDKVVEDALKDKNKQGTYYAKALELVNREMLSYDKTDIKHVIFLSDGVSNDSGYISYVASMFQKGVTCSTIGIGDGIDASELERMASIGGGNFYSVTKASELNSIMLQETQSLQSSYINEGTIKPIIKSHTSVMRGITTLPNVGGYVGVTSKSEATVVLQANNDPLYVEWVYENNRVKCGKVASFMSDLSGNWTSEYFVDERGIQFINNVVNNLLTTTTTRSDVSIQFNAKNFQNVLVVNTPSVEGIGTVKASITYPDKSSKIIDLPQTAASVYSSIIPNFGEQAGVYKVEVTKTIGTKVTREINYITFSYSEEFNSFVDTSNVLEFVNQLAVNGKGKLYTLKDDILDNENIYDEYIIDPQPTFMILALVLFLLDIIVRKFNFKWPHELFRKKVENKR